MILKAFKKILIIYIFLTVFLISFSAKSNNFYFAGFSFLGNADQDFRYPVAVSLFNKNPIIFKDPLGNALVNLRREDINFIQELGTISSGEAVAIAFALMDEVIERFSINEGVMNSYKIFAQILVF